MITIKISRGDLIDYITLRAFVYFGPDYEKKQEHQDFNKSEYGIEHISTDFIDYIITFDSEESLTKFLLAL